MIPASVSGYYNVRSVSNNKNFDVNGDSKTAGANIITYNPGTANNQMFAFVETEEGLIIYARSSKLPIEDSADKVKQNDRRESPVQYWEVVEVEPVAESGDVYHTLSIDSLALTDADSLSALPASGDDAQKWLLTPDDDGEYIITNASTSKSLDVANNSTTPGDPVITYTTSGDDNQRWILEKTDDGTFLIKSVHSSLYLTVSGSSLVQNEINDGAMQKWSISVAE